jgi:hypothetical protein
VRVKNILSSMSLVVALAAVSAGACKSKTQDEPAPTPAPAPVAQPTPPAGSSAPAAGSAAPVAGSAADPAPAPAPAGATGYKLVEDGDDGASCTKYKVVDANGGAAPLPKDIAENLACFAGISPEGRVVFYASGDELRTYDLVAKKDDRLVQFEPGGEGLDGPKWSSDGARVAFVTINQKGYAKGVRVFAWKYAAGAFTDKQRHDVAAAFECGSQCVPMDWGWKDASTVFYASGGAGGEAGPVETIEL